MDVCPKRRKYKDNPYNLSSDKKNGLYYVSFIDSRGILQYIEINKTIFDELNKFELKDVSQMNEYDNHIEHLELNDEELYHRRKIDTNDYYNENILNKILIKDLMKEIKKLPIQQRNRLIKYYFYNMSYEKIAKEEGKVKSVIKYSIDKAIEKISKNFKKN